MAIEITSTQGEGLQALLDKLKSVVGKGVYVGIPAENNPPVMKKDKHGNDVEQAQFNMASLVAVLEFGNEHIPSRPFLRKTLAENQQKYTAFFANAFESGVEPLAIYQQLALIAQSDVKKNIVKGDWVANAPSTIKRKKSSKPLIDTGRMRQSIMGVVK